MKRLFIKKIIVISDIEKSSRELNFKRGLNIIIGDNKTGKSSLIKSIFFALGCETRIESDWKKLISTYILFFEYGEQEFCIVRQNGFYKIYSSNTNETFLLIKETKNFHEYSECLMNILDVTMDCLIKSNRVQISATPPLLFRFQYIDQDKGWNKIAESFHNMQYIDNWKPNSNKYIVGYQDEEYYKTKQFIGLATDKINKLKIKVSYYDEFVENLTNSIHEDYISANKTLVIKDEISLANSLLSELSQLEKNKIKLAENISVLNNEKYEKFLEMEAIKRHIENLDKDHQFAMSQDDIIKCPFCGAEHKNSIEERIEIIKDMQTGNELINLCRQDIKALENELAELEKNRSQNLHNYNIKKRALEKTKENASIITTYKQEGKYEIINKSISEKNQIQTQLNTEESIKNQYELYLKKLISTTKSKEIRKKLIDVYTNVLTNVNIPINYIKISDFVQVLNKTGSEMPRIILAYQVALYLYNLKRESPFNWLVIDTPNQQGQDGKNLQNIDSILEYLLDEKGEAIIGTERKTGYENRASNVIELSQHKRCLSQKTYNLHLELLNSLNPR